MTGDIFSNTLPLMVLLSVHSAEYVAFLACVHRLHTSFNSRFAPNFTGNYFEKDSIFFTAGIAPLSIIRLEAPHGSVSLCERPCWKPCLIYFCIKTDKNGFHCLTWVMCKINHFLLISFFLIPATLAITANKCSNHSFRCSGL